MKYLPSTISAAVVGCLFAHQTSALPPTRSECLHTRSRDLARLSSCGDQGTLEACLASLGKYFIQSDIEQCFLTAGCLSDDASVEAIWVYRRCESFDTSGELKLRKRQAKTTPKPTPEEEEPAPTEDAKDDKPETPAKTPAKTPAAQTTAKKEDDKPAKTTPAAKPEQTSDDASPSTQPDPATTPPPPEAQSTGIPPDQCMTTPIIHTTLCGPNPQGDITCRAEDLAIPTCRPGLICRIEQGATTCMALNNKLSTVGVIIAIFFATAIAAAIGLMTFFCCRERSQQRKLKAKTEAAIIAKASAIGGAASSRNMRNVSDRQPLMGAAGPQGYGGPIDDPQHDPFHDQHRVG